MNTLLKPNHTCRLMAVGDIMLHGRIAEAITANDDPLFPWRNVMPMLKGADILFGNLETMITRDRTPYPGTPGKYFSLPGTGQALKQIGFSVVNIGHNHTYDWGDEGVETTFQELQSAQIAYGGAGKTTAEAKRPAFVQCPTCGKRFAFLCYCSTYNTLDKSHGYVVAAPDAPTLRKDISSAREQSDIVVVSIHGGACMNYWPSPDMLKACRTAAEYGAHIVLGHHPHVPQGIELRNGALIAYGMPDFIRPVPYDDDEVYEGMRADFYESFILNVNFQKALSLEWEIVPCILDESLQTNTAEGTIAEEIRTRRKKLSADIINNQSDQLHLTHASKYFRVAYGKSLWRSFRKGGVSWLFRRILTIKPHHIAIGLNGIKQMMQKKPKIAD